MEVRKVELVRVTAEGSLKRLLDFLKSNGVCVLSFLFGIPRHAAQRAMAAAVAFYMTVFLDRRVPLLFPRG